LNKSKSTIKVDPKTKKRRFKEPKNTKVLVEQSIFNNRGQYFNVDGLSGDIIIGTQDGNMSIYNFDGALITKCALTVKKIKSEILPTGLTL
jgi:hypothetical protein